MVLVAGLVEHVDQTQLEHAYHLALHLLVECGLVCIVREIVVELVLVAIIVLDHLLRLEHVLPVVLPVLVLVQTGADDFYQNVAHPGEVRMVFIV